MRKYSFFVVLVWSCFQTAVCKAQLTDSIKNHIDTALNILKQQSLYAGRVDWTDIDRQVYAKAAKATTTVQTFEALTIAFTADHEWAE